MKEFLRREVLNTEFWFYKLCAIGGTAGLIVLLVVDAFT